MVETPEARRRVEATLAAARRARGCGADRHPRQRRQPVPPLAGWGVCHAGRRARAQLAAAAHPAHVRPVGDRRGHRDRRCRAPAGWAARPAARVDDRGARPRRPARRHRAGGALHRRRQRAAAPRGHHAHAHRRDLRPDAARPIRAVARSPPRGRGGRTGAAALPPVRPARVHAGRLPVPHADHAGGGRRRRRACARARPLSQSARRRTRRPNRWRPPVAADEHEHRLHRGWRASARPHRAGGRDRPARVRRRAAALDCRGGDRARLLDRLLGALCGHAPRERRRPAVLLAAARVRPADAGLGRRLVRQRRQLRRLEAAGAVPDRPDGLPVRPRRARRRRCCRSSSRWARRARRGASCSTGCSTTTTSGSARRVRSATT